MTRKTLLSLAALVIVIGVAALGVIGWMVFQPGPYSFAAGRPSRWPITRRVPHRRAGGTRQRRSGNARRLHHQHGGLSGVPYRAGGKPFAGGRAFVLPFGTIYSPNLTPDPETGIGKWTDAQFLNAVHRGVAPDGSRYYPAFPIRPTPC